MNFSAAKPHPRDPTEGSGILFHCLPTHVCEQALGCIRAASLGGPRACSSTHSIAAPSGEGVGTSKRQRDYVDSRQEVGMNADAGCIYDF